MGYKTLPKQFLVGSLLPGCLPPEWLRETCLGIDFVHAPEVPLYKLRFKDRVVGAALGWFVYDDRFFWGRESPEHRVVDLDAHNCIDDFADKACGRFLLFDGRSQFVKVSTDACGLLPCIIDQESGWIASSPAAISVFKDLSRSRESSVIRDVVRLDGKVWYPFGIVPFREMERLLPGFSWTFGLNRLSSDNLGFHLKANRPSTWEDGILEIANHGASFIKAIARSSDIIEAHLTAGRDSRMLAAVCSLAKSKTKYITYAARGATSDVDTAKMICRTLKLNHEVITLEAMTEQDRSEWFARTGECLRDSVMDLSNTVLHTYSGRPTLTGMCGEIARGFYWEKSDIDKISITPEKLLSRLGFRCTNYLLMRADAWLESYKSYQRTVVLDLAYIQIRLACWGGASAYGHLIPVPTITPFSRKDMASRMLSLDPVKRFKQDFAEDLIAFADPRMLEFKFNPNGGWGDLTSLIKKSLPESVKSTLKRF